jgi:hypothetical protein
MFLYAPVAMTYGYPHTALPLRQVALSTVVREVRSVSAKTPAGRFTASGLVSPRVCHNGRYWVHLVVVGEDFKLDGKRGIRGGVGANRFDLQALEVLQPELLLATVETAVAGAQIIPQRLLKLR